MADPMTLAERPVANVDARSARGEFAAPVDEDLGAERPDTVDRRAEVLGADDARRATDADSTTTASHSTDILISQATAVLLVLCAYLVLAILLPPHLGPKASATAASADVRPAWYLLPLYGYARLVPPALAILSPVAFLVVLGAVPFIDRAGVRTPAGRAAALALGVALAVGLVLLAVIGTRAV